MILFGQPGNRIRDTDEYLDWKNFKWTFYRNEQGEVTHAIWDNPARKTVFSELDSTGTAYVLDPDSKTP